MKHIKHMNKQEKINFMMGLGLLAAILIGVFFYLGSLPQAPSYETPGVVPKNQAGQQNTNTGSVDQKTAVALTYEAAVAKYQGKRIQFGFYQNQYCTVNPSNVVYKNGTEIMLDNRTNTTLKVALDSKVFNIPPYGFVITRVSTSSALPHTVSIDCGNGYNNGSIMLQQ